MNLIIDFQFDGPSGECLQQSAATFCKYQSVALENLRDRRKKESKLQVKLLVVAVVIVIAIVTVLVVVIVVVIV